MKLSLGRNKSYIDNCENADKMEIPKVFAFEIETNLRNLIEEIVEPVVNINKKNNTRLEHLENVTR